MEHPGHNNRSSRPRSEAQCKRGRAVGSGLLPNAEPQPGIVSPPPRPVRRTPTYGGIPGHFDPGGGSHSDLFERVLK